MERVLIPAAEYVRMSTDQQEFSIANQQQQIRKYAEQHGFKIVQTYADKGRSGLTIRERKALSQLLADALSGIAPFKAICVYDVSRWGRFQDCDESAHYEFLCKNAGIPVHYCAEQFSNDGTMPSAMFKALRRTMAAEYSRDLSSRSAASKRRFALMGFRQGGEPGFGFRRLVVSADGRPRRILKPGERKPYATDRMKLVHGPRKEVSLVRRIFRTFIEGRGKIGPTHLAAQLNSEGLRFVGGKPWSNQSVRGVLDNPKYAGINTWGRTTTLLHTRTRVTSADHWITVPGAFEPIIDRGTFDKAQQLLRVRAEGRTRPAELVRELKRILKKRGRLCKAYLGRNNGTYGECTFSRALGGFKRAYELAGFEYPAGIFSNREHGIRTEMIRNQILKHILELFPRDFMAFRLPRAVRRTSLLFDGKFKLFVWIAKHRFSGGGHHVWHIQPPPRERGGITIICTLAPGNERVEDLYLYPSLELDCTQYSFRAEDPLLSKGVKLGDLAFLVKTARTLLVENAVTVPALDHNGWRRSTLDDQLAGRLQPDENRRSSPLSS